MSSSLKNNYLNYYSWGMASIYNCIYIIAIIICCNAHHIHDCKYEVSKDSNKIQKNSNGVLEKIRIRRETYYPLSYRKINPYYVPLQRNFPVYYQPQRIFIQETFPPRHVVYPKTNFGPNLYNFNKKPWSVSRIEDDDRPVWDDVPGEQLGSDSKAKFFTSTKRPIRTKVPIYPNMATDDVIEGFRHGFTTPPVNTLPPVLRQDELLKRFGNNRIKFPIRTPSKNFLENQIAVLPLSETTTTTEKTAGVPEPCVWAIITCCPVTNASIRSSCFKQKGCEASSSEANPCQGDVVREALTSAVNYFKNK